MIIHIVLFQPKNDVTPEQRHAFAESLQRAVTEIPQVQRAQVGKAVEVGVSYEAKLGRPAYEYVALLEFANLADLRTYLDHPVHSELGAMFWKTCESTLIMDAEMGGTILDILDLA